LLVSQSSPRKRWGNRRGTTHPPAEGHEPDAAVLSRHVVLRGKRAEEGRLAHTGGETKTVGYRAPGGKYLGHVRVLDVTVCLEVRAEGVVRHLRRHSRDEDARATRGGTAAHVVLVAAAADAAAASLVPMITKPKPRERPLMWSCSTESKRSTVRVGLSTPKYWVGKAVSSFCSDANNCAYLHDGGFLHASQLREVLLQRRLPVGASSPPIFAQRRKLE
jgi:hypothetical protein